MEPDFFQNSKKSKRIRIEEIDEIKVVLVNGQQYMSWELGDEESQRFAVVQLYRCGLETQEKLAGLFGLHVNTVQKYVADFTRAGLQGLVPQRSGPKDKWKITPEIKAQILFIALKEGILGYDAIQKRLTKWDEHVSIPSIRQVLLENGIIKDTSVPDPKVQQEELFNFPDKEQIYLDFGIAGKLAETISEKGVKSNEEKSVDVGEVESSSGRMKNDRSFFSQAQRVYLDQLEHGCYNAYAGGLLFVPLLEKYSFLPPLGRIIKIPTYEGYSLEELCLTLFYIDSFGFRSMEDFKRVYPEEFGALIGRSFSPSRFTLRRFLHKARKLKKSEELINEFAYEYLKSGIARFSVLYIDGHFLPYHGMYPITKGWHGVRQMPMKGSYNFLGVDENFTPWIFLIRSSSEDLLQKIPEIIAKAKEAAARVGVDQEQLEDLVVVFDREGYSAELYRYLEGRDKEDKKRRAIFISWAKYADKWVYDIPDEKFDHTLIVAYDIQEAEEVRYFETKRTMSKYGNIRSIVIESCEDRKRAAIYTNGDEDEIDSDTVIQLICRRWGEENKIKELMIKHFINYTPGYVKERMAEQPLVDNPKVKKLKKEKAKITGELHKLKVKLTDKLLAEARDGMNWEEIKRNQIELLADIAIGNNEILFLDQRLDKLPKKIPFDRAHGGKKLLNLNFEKKRFLDCIKVFSCNMQQQMCKILLDYYDKKKEIMPALAMILNRGGYMKLEHGSLRVRLRRFKNQEIDYAARRLCEKLNLMNPHTLDRFRLPIKYEIQ